MSMTRDADGKPGLRLETAASVVLRDMITRHISTFANVIRADRLTGQATSAVYIDGLAGTLALVIAGKHGSKDDVINATITKLREAIDRDLQHLKA